MVELHERVNLLINNAGVALGGSVEQLSIDNIAWLFGIDFWGVVYGVKYFLPILLKQAEAHIVDLSSVFGLFAPPGQSAYAASKFAVRGFSDSLRQELATSSVVEANKARILIGRGAFLSDRIMRLAPVRGPALLQRMSIRMVGMR